MKQLHFTQILGLILLLAGGLRLPLLAGSFWLDEAAQVLESARPFSQQLDIAKDFQPPLLHYVLHFALYLSSSEAWLRTVGALLPGLITVAATAMIGKALISRSAGLTAALLLATSSFHIYFSQELRPYSLPAMWAALSWWLVIRLTQSTTQPRKLYAAYALCSILGLYSSYLYPFLLIAQVGYIFLHHRNKIQSFLTTWLLTALSFLPWLPSFYAQLRVGGEWREQLPGWENVVSFSQLKSVLLVAGKFLFGVINLESTLFFLVSLGAFGGLVGWGIWSYVRAIPVKQRFSQLVTDRTLATLLIWLVIPLLTAWLVSFWIPVVQPKRVLYLLPAFYLIMTWLATQSTFKYGRVLVSLLLLLNLYGVSRYYLDPQLQRENWRSLHQTITQRYPQNDTLVVFSFDEPFAPWRWYDSAQYDTLSTGQLYIDDVENLSQRLEKVTEYKYILVFDYLRDLTDPENKLLREIEAYGFTHLDTLDQPNIGFVRVYSKKEHVLTQL